MAGRSKAYAQGIEGRRDVRYPTDGYSCPLGAVLDVSASGLRLRSTKKPEAAVGDVISLAVRSSRQLLTVSGRIAWIRRKGLRNASYEIGVRFADQREGIRHAVEQFARVGHVDTKGTGPLKPEDGPSHAGERNTPNPTSEPAPSQNSVPAAAIEVEDLYALLEIDSTATGEDIRRAYRALALRYHPDRSPGEASAERFDRAAKAYRVLKNPVTRARYDEMLRAWRHAA
ncbi:MAG: DnaJ domain-containing protein [Phycisphaeraceae bacterium]|nr:DnaJ domain-containing protein [Phycisphaeraceae bacterium]